tara:strand:+ start:273 stop:671 length:399 start_codon:yes stop_codon:yes gene_type:complete
MRLINKVIIHCAETKTNQSFDISEVDLWHRKRGFDKVGYHYYIRLDGTLQIGRELEEIGAHCKGQNSKSIGICFEGGLNPNGSSWDSPLNEQLLTYDVLIAYINSIYGKLNVFGHYEFSEKTCPNFIIDEVL